MSLEELYAKPLIEHLRNALEGEYPSHGLCTFCKTVEEDELLQGTIRELGYYTEDSPSFPIAPPIGYLQDMQVGSRGNLVLIPDAHTVYIENIENLWNPKDRYCARRRAVAELMIKKLEGAEKCLNQ